MKLLRSILLITLAFTGFSVAAQNSVSATSGKAKVESLAKRQMMEDNSLISNLKTKCIGPTVFSGRVVDMAINPEDPTEFYVAYASGGLWHTTNNAVTFRPIFDHEAVMTLGAIAVHWPTRTIVVGTGEVNSSRSSYAGIGLFKSTDNGDNWTYLGLPESHHIGRITIHPTDVNDISVAVLGHLYSANSERGVYRSTDGGNSWTHALSVNDNAGAVDLVRDQQDPNLLFAAIWERTRRAWNFVESGAGSGIYKSTDGGSTWDLITTGGNGFPQGEGTGRIGLSLARKDGKLSVYAILDNYNRRAKEEDDKKEGLEKDDFKTMHRDSFLKLTEEELGKYLKANRFPEKYDAEIVIEMVKEGKIEPVALAEYLEDANRMLFDTPVIGAEVYVSSDEGGSWKKTHDGYIDRLFNSYGYYFAQVVTTYENPQVLYIMGVPILKSSDGGSSWKSVNGHNVHVDHHYLWINPNKEDHIINGNDGGVNISYDGGENWIKCNMPPVGQFYYVNVDYTKDYKVYGGTQDNGVWVGSHSSTPGVRWQMNGSYPYKTIMGGDGMQVQIDKQNPNIVYTGYQFGNYFRINQSTGDRSYITPKHELGDAPYRWNWQSPILISPHNQDIIYFGANKLMRSLNRGDDFEEISEDLTKGGMKGDVAFGTITSIDESKFDFGKIVIGTDDGNISLTKDGGKSWDLISAELPQDLWVSRVQLSKHDESTIYASLNGYRWDNFEAYMYVSKDDGLTWTSLADDFPLEPVNVIKEDPMDQEILYVGTDHGVYVSMDSGSTFMKYSKELPNVPVHDLVVQVAKDDLVIGTHGRSIYISNLKDVRKMKSSTESLAILNASGIRYSSRWGSKSTVYSDTYEPTTDISVYSANGGVGTFSIQTEEGKELYSEEMSLDRGINYVQYNYTANDKGAKQLRKMLEKQAEDKDKVEVEKADDGKYYLQPGTYKVVMSQGGKTSEETFKIK